MSEISDAVQIIRVGYDTIEIAMKVGSGSIEMMQIERMGSRRCFFIVKRHRDFV